MTTNDHRPVLRGELVLVLAVIINSIGVLLMLHSGSGISAISSVPYAFNLVLPKLSLGTWTYIFQGLLVCVLMILRRKFVPAYLFSFVVGFCFGKMMDINELWVDPSSIEYSPSSCLLYIKLSDFVFRHCLSNRCKLPITPTDLFPREMEDITGKPYSKIKISYDVTCLIITACMTFFFLGHISGLGIGTVLAAFTMGKGVALVGKKIDKKAAFVSFLEH